MAAAFIEDGYTVENLTIPALRGHHPEVKLSYRPATLREMRTIDKKITADGVTVDQAIDATNAFIASHVVTWDVVNGKGEAVPITPATVERLESVLAAQIFNICRGIYPENVTVPPADQGNPAGN